MFSFTFGDVGSGKSLYQVYKTLNLIQRSIWIEKKYKLHRDIYINFHLRKELMEKYKDRLHYWTDPMTLTQLKDVDIMWDELAVELPADKWKETHHEIRRLFAQHRKRGIEIYGNTQDYKMVDINARRMADHRRIYYTHKLIGSRDKSATLPKIRFVWGLIAIWNLKKSSLEDNAVKEKLSILPKLLPITKKLIQAYDTGEDIKPAPDRPLRHIERICLTCGRKTISHA